MLRTCRQRVADLRAEISQHFHGSPEAGASKTWVPKLSLGTSLEPGAYARSQAPLGNAVREALLPNQEAGAVGQQPFTSLGFCNRV